jgi:predicted HAD superfamily Cof-like phosphohydrolase
MLTRSENVKIFTEESKNISLPNQPRKMTRAEVLFSVKMVVEELQELLITVTHNHEDSKELLIDIVNNSRYPENGNYVHFSNKTDLELMAEQVDAFVDIDYYNCNAAAKVGFNIDDVFNIVHKANMNKKFEDGTFHENSEGKIIKPEGWVEPDVTAVVSGWIDHGTWNKNK